MTVLTSLRCCETFEPSKIAMLEKIDTWNWNRLKWHAIERGKIDVSLADRGIDELKKFFGIVAIQDEPIAVLSNEVDALWHEFINRTEEYAHFCNRVFGSFVHHRPNSQGMPVPQAAVKNSVRLYNETFSQRDALWTSMCGPECFEFLSGRRDSLPQQFLWSGWPGR